MDIEFWSQHIRSQEKGRLSIKKYCEENQIPEWKFYSKRKLVRASESNFAEVTIMPDDFYEIQLDDFLSLSIRRNTPLSHLCLKISQLMRLLK